MKPGNPAAAGGGFVMAVGEGRAFWFLNTLTINKSAATTASGR